MKNIKYYTLVAAVLAVVYWLQPSQPLVPDDDIIKQPSGKLLAAFQQQKSDVQLQGQGRVSKILPDDLKGSKHQKFILTTPENITLLVSHNIDLAPKILDLAVGDLVEFNGEYEWSAKGGVLHWTHRDPSGRHAGGWLKHKEKIFE
jgi:hypothetical protein